MLSKSQMTWLKVVVFIAALLPLLVVILGILKQDLGPDPVAHLTHHTGRWALRFLLITLAITPLRHLTGWNEWIRLRRMLGLYAFFYASLHLGVYVVLDLQAYWSQLWTDIIKRPFITVGFASWLLLVPLAITSTQSMMRRLGKNWLRLHKLVYLIAILAVLHFWWLVKADVRTPLIYAAILAFLLMFRVIWNRRKKPSALGRSAVSERAVLTPKSSQQQPKQQPSDGSAGQQ